MVMTGNVSGRGVKMAAKKLWAWVDTETTGFFPAKGARVLQVSVHVTDDQLRDQTKGGRITYTSDIQIPVEALMRASPKALEVNHFARVVTIESLRELPEAERPLVACGKYATVVASDEVLDDWEVRIKPDKKDYKVDNLVAVMIDPAAYFAAPAPYKVWETVHTMLSGCHLVCQNLLFDKPFIENELALAGLTYPCDFRAVEIMSFSNLLSQHLGLTAWGLDKLYDTAAEKWGLEKLSAHRADGDVARMMAVYKLVRTKFMGAFVWEEACDIRNEFLTELAGKLGVEDVGTWPGTARNVADKIDHGVSSMAQIRAVLELPQDATIEAILEKIAEIQQQHCPRCSC